MANFLAMIAYYKLFTRLKKQSLLPKYSPKDIIELSKAIYKVKVNNQWITSEITVKTKSLFKKIDIDYLTWAELGTNFTTVNFLGESLKIIKLIKASYVQVTA